MKEPERSGKEESLPAGVDCERVLTAMCDVLGIPIERLIETATRLVQHNCQDLFRTIINATAYTPEHFWKVGPQRHRTYMKIRRMLGLEDKQ